MAPFSVVIGASKGIGREIALRLTNDGVDFTINSRNAEELENLPHRRYETGAAKWATYLGRLWLSV